jgi:hypothetical protein
MTDNDNSMGDFQFGDKEQTMGDFRFGLNNQELHSRFVDSLYRELEPIKAWGEIPAGITYWDIADVIIDTISGYTTIAAIPATEIPALITDALEQIKE